MIGMSPQKRRRKAIMENVSYEDLPPDIAEELAALEEVKDVDEYREREAALQDRCLRERRFFHGCCNWPFHFQLVGQIWSVPRYCPFCGRDGAGLPGWAKKEEDGEEKEER